ncbi:MAG: hypothetical protein GTO08_12010, partial [Deltaproteobacteria bacterium]|nr:hypothetical protein [Deltaproteobacteria bacterium]
KAVDDFKKALDLRPDSAIYRLNLAGAYMAEGEHDRADSEAKKAFEEGAKNARLNFKMGRMYEAGGFIEEA